MLNTVCRRLAVAVRSRRAPMSLHQPASPSNEGRRDALPAAGAAGPGLGPSSTPGPRVTRAARRAQKLEEEEEEGLPAVQARLQQVVQPVAALQHVASKQAAVLVSLFAACAPDPHSSHAKGADQTQEQQEQRERAEVRVVLTRRSSRLTSHQGEVCLPGGKRDPEDVDDVATALREANEELGLEPGHAQVLGCLQPLLSKHFLSVTPVVSLVPSERALHAPRPNVEEVDEVFDVPLSLFLGTRGHSSRDVKWQDLCYRIHTFEHEGHTIWGLTASILIKVAKLAFGREPDFQEHAPNGINYQRLWHDGQRLQVHTTAAPE